MTKFLAVWGEIAEDAMLNNNFGQTELHCPDDLGN